MSADKKKDEARQRWRQEIGGRIRAERERLGIGQGELARKLQYTKQLTSHWESGRSELMIYDLARLRQLGFDATYLIAGVREAPKFSVKLPTNVVPHPTHAELLKVAAGQLDTSTVTNSRAIYTGAVERGLAVEVTDAGLAPRIPAGSLVIVDRARKPQDGDLVCIVLLATAEILVRRFKPGRGGRFSLLADNTLIPNREITDAHQAVVIGVAVEIVLKASS